MPMRDDIMFREVGSGSTWVRLMSMVFLGSNSLTISVTTTVSVDGGVLLAGTVTVLILSDVRVRVRISVAGAAEVVAAEPPSMATTEYATRLRTAGCLGDARGLNGKAWDKRLKEQSANMKRIDVRHIIKSIAKREYWKLLMGAESGSTRESRYFRNGERERDYAVWERTFLYQLIAFGDGW